MVTKLLERFMKKDCKEAFRVEKVIKRKVDKLYAKWKGLTILLTAGLIKKT